MADLNELNASGSTKIVGSDSTGAETNYVNASTNGLRVDGSAVTQPVSATSLPLPTGAATESTLSALSSNLTNGSAVSVVRGQYNVSPPTLSSGSNGVLQLDSSGRALVNVQSMPGVSVATSVLPTGAATESTLSSINTKLTDSPYGVTLAIAAADVATTTTGNLVIGTPTSSSFAPFNISNLSSGLLQITGTWVGTIVFEISQDGVNYVPSTLTVPNLGTILSTTINTEGFINLSGVISVRARATSWTSGFASINLYRNSSLGTTFISNPNIGTKKVKVAESGSSPATATVNTASSTVVSANSNRTGLVITVVSGARVFLAFGSNAAVANRGIMLTTGGTFVMDDYTFSLESIQAITGSGTVVLAIQEFT